MDWVRAAASAASAALAGSGGIPGLPAYSLGERVSDYDGLSLWTLFEGTKKASLTLQERRVLSSYKEDSSPVSVFAFDTNTPNARRALLPLARNALRKLKTLRHPDVLKYLDGTENDSAVWIVTERVTPLTSRLGPEGQIKNEGTDEWKIWGLSRVTNALAFINSSGASTHGNIRLASLFVTPGGEWRLGGFDVLSAPNDPASVLYSQGGILPNASKYASPETRASGYGVLKDLPTHALDAYQLHLLIHVLFNGPLPASFSSDSQPSLPQSRGATPLPLFQASRRLGQANAASRLRIEAFHELGMAKEGAMASAGFYSSNRLIKLSAGLENFALASEGERAALVRIVKDSNQALPPEFLAYKVLPALVKAFEFGPDGPALLPLLLSLGGALPPAEYTRHLLQPLVRMYASPDRAMRLALLENMPQYADKLENKLVCEKVWPHLLTGFGDVVPVIREATVKSVLLIAPKLTERLLNNDLLRHLAKTQTDPEPGIRTNTCILLGRLSKHLSTSTNRKVLIPAFARALRDNFVHARIAGLMALMATVDCYEREDLAGKVIPSMAICLVDKEKTVRDQAFKAIDMFVKRVETQVADMPATVLPPPSAGLAVNGDGASAPAPPGLATNAAGAAGALAGWAFSSISKRLAAGELESPIESRPASAPPIPVQERPAGPSAPSTPATVARANLGSFGLASASTTSLNSANEDWGGDLIDVNADADDWDAFESAPAPPAVDPLAARLSSTKKAASLSVVKPIAKPAKPPVRPVSATPGASLKLGASKSAAATHSSLARQLEAEAAGTDDAGWDLDEPATDAWDTPAASAAGDEDWGAFDADPPRKTIAKSVRGRGAAVPSRGVRKKLGP